MYFSVCIWGFFLDLVDYKLSYWLCCTFYLIGILPQGCINWLGRFINLRRSMFFNRACWFVLIAWKIFNIISAFFFFLYWWTVLMKSREKWFCCWDKSLKCSMFSFVPVVICGKQLFYLLFSICLASGYLSWILTRLSCEGLWILINLGWLCYKWRLFRCWSRCCSDIMSWTITRVVSCQCMWYLKSIQFSITNKPFHFYRDFLHNCDVTTSFVQYLICSMHHSRWIVWSPMHKFSWSITFPPQCNLLMNVIRIWHLFIVKVRYLTYFWMLYL